MTIPPIRVSPELRKQAEAVLEPGETLSALALGSLSRTIQYRKFRQEFIARGMASGHEARSTGKYVSAERVVGKLERRLKKAQERVR